MTKQREKLEDNYQDLASLIENNSYFYELVEEAYPRLVIQHIDTKEKFEITIKKIKD